jgi:aminopeptidase N
MKRFTYLLLFFCFISYGQQTENVDFISLNAQLYPHFESKSITGELTYDFVLKNKKDTISIDAVNMQFDNVKINGKAVNYEVTNSKIKLFEGFKKGKNSLTFHYKANPKQTMYFVGDSNDYQIWTQGQGKYTSHWLPSFDDVNEKVIFNLAIAYDTNFTVLSNGKLESEIVQNGTKTWKYTMDKPMSSYLVMLAIGYFNKEGEISTSGIPLEYYIDQNDVAKFEPTYRYSKVIFDFLENEIGEAFPWYVYRQVPVRDFLYAGMENTTATIFSQEFVVDSIGFNDKNYVNVNAHELAHQWFGDCVTAREGKHHWLQEGFATYYALLAEQSIYGDDYFYFQLWDMARQLSQANEEVPVLNEKASSLTFYKKGAWALHILRSEVGADNFKTAIKNYLKKYAYKTADTDAFLAEINKVSQFDTNTFKMMWLETPGFDFNAIQKYISSNSFLNEFYTILNNYNVAFEEKKSYYETIMQSDVFFQAKKEILYQCRTVPFENKRRLIELAMATNDVHVRQAVAETVDFIPQNFQQEFETLLADNSYITREIALFKLWRNFKDDQYYYALTSTEWEGLNYNLKVANYTLKIVTKGIAPQDKIAAISGLEQMTKLPYETMVREAAIKTILSLNIPSEQVYLSLIDATLHHKWQFVKFGKDNLRVLLSNPEKRQMLINLEPKMSTIQKERFATFLNETR